NSGISAAPTGTVEFTTATAGDANQFKTLSGTVQFPNLTLSGANDPNWNAIAGTTIGVAGNFTNNNTTAANPILTGVANTFLFNGSGAQSIGGTKSTAFNAVTVNSGSTTTQTAVISAAGAFTNGGTYNQNVAASFAGNFTN